MNYSKNQSIKSWLEDENDEIVGGAGDVKKKSVIEKKVCENDTELEQKY